MADGDGTLRLPFAYNYFVIVGPRERPRRSRRGVLSRGRRSPPSPTCRAAVRVARRRVGHQQEGAQDLGRRPASSPTGAWYISTGQGMGETLRIASEKQGYTLTDLGTLLSQADSLDLKPLYTASDDLKNVYDVIVVDQNEFPAVNAAAGRAACPAAGQRRGSEGHRRLRPEPVRGAAVPPVRERSGRVLTAALGHGRHSHAGTLGRLRRGASPAPRRRCRDLPDHPALALGLRAGATRCRTRGGAPGRR